jgi:hypothetical protein
MAIDRIGSPLRPNPTRRESGRRKRPEHGPQKKRNEDPNPRPGHIDELA